MTDPMAPRTLALIAFLPTLAFAQSRADSVLEHGALAQAESMYYAAVRARPRDPAARRELGEYLVERGAPRVGMTLLEEAQRFGADPREVSRLLAPVYLSLGEYRSLAALPTPPLSRGEHDRARWLESHPTAIATPDSTIVATYRETPGSESLGHITIRVNGRPVEATLSVRTRGIVVSDQSPAARNLRRFATPASAADTGSRAVLAVADSIGVSRLAILNYPVSIQPLGDKEQATIGLDVIGRFAPTFDPHTSRVTLRTSGRVDARLRNAGGLATRLTANDLLVLQGGGWVSATQPRISRILSERRWTLDAKRGQIIVEQ
jgi:hypothetical protein